MYSDKLELVIEPKVHEVYARYPEGVGEAMKNLRRLIHEVATTSPLISHLEETLKWGEPSFITKYGSTLRMDWKEKTPDQYALYFKCTSLLVETFKKVYTNTFNYEGSRAIVFKLGEDIPEKEVKSCIEAALIYHRIKKLPLLGLVKH